MAFCGPIADAGKPAGGGYEAANRRTCDALRRRGLRVAELPYPKASTSPLKRLCSYAHSFGKAATFLVAKRKHYDVLHLTPLNMNFAWAETLLVSCARLMGKAVLLDIRAGSFLNYYQNAGALYRSVIDRSLRRASQVSVEGQEFVPFIRKRTRRPVFYFPNYVDGPSLQSLDAKQSLAEGDTVRLLYFGRVVPEKGIETALRTLETLAARGHAVHLEIIGGGPAAFAADMRERFAQVPVTWTPSLPIGDILQRAAQAHFFFFASRHSGEGHSNSLNEAMSVGMVPICSDQGFTRSVVGNAGIVLPATAEAPDYVAAIETILSGKQWSKLSCRARNRVRTLYSEDVTLPSLINTYRQMLHRP